MLERQHKAAEVACYRPREDTDGGPSDTPSWGVGAPHQCLRVKQKNEVDPSHRCHWPKQECVVVAQEFGSPRPIRCYHGQPHRHCFHYGPSFDKERSSNDRERTRLMSAYALLRSYFVVVRLDVWIDAQHSVPTMTHHYDSSLLRLDVWIDEQHLRNGSCCC